MSNSSASVQSLTLELHPLMYFTASLEYLALSRCLLAASATDTRKHPQQKSRSGDSLKVLHPHSATQILERHTLQLTSLQLGSVLRFLQPHDGLFSSMLDSLISCCLHSQGSPSEEHLHKLPVPTFIGPNPSMLLAPVFTGGINFEVFRQPASQHPDLAALCWSLQGFSLPGL